MNARLQVLVDRRRIRPVSATDEQIAARWKKALGFLRDSHWEELHAESAFMLAYYSTVVCAAAVLHAAGFRAPGWEPDEQIFEGVATLDAGDVSQAAAAAGEMYTTMQQVLLGPAMVDLATLEEMYQVATRLFAAAHTWLADARPGLKLTPPPG